MFNAAAFFGIFSNLAWKTEYKFVSFLTHARTQLFVGEILYLKIF